MWKKILKITAGIIIATGLIGVIAISLIVSHYKKEIPNISQLVESYTPSIPTEIYDRNGKVIDVIYKESRVPIKFENVPDVVKNAFLSVEDRRFYNHYGIDPLGLIRAIFINTVSGKAKQGASSFTQQLSRNAFLSHERKLSRKIKEAIITIEIEKRYTKDEIFEKYLNEIYFGDGDYGIRSASQSLFKKEPKDLNIPESAMLAGMPNRPGAYNPRRNLKLSLGRMQVVLGQMLKYDMISKEEYDKAMSHKFILEEKLPKDFDFSKVDKDTTTIVYKKGFVNKSKVPSFTDTIQEILLKNFDEETIYNGGLKVYTTLDFDIQKVAEETFNNYGPMVKDKELQGAMITINSSNGHVLSIVGGKHFQPGNFNRALNAKRQIGSAFKPFVYLSAIIDGKSENTIVEDSRVIFGNWAPKNVGTLYRKNSTLLEGLDKSVNMVSIKLLKDVGYEKLKETIIKTKANLNPPEDLTASLGSLVGTPMELAKAYAVFSNGGYSIEPVFLLEVTDRNNNTLYKDTPKIEKSFEPEDIALMTNLLISSTKTGTSHAAEVKTKHGKYIEQGGKTGTTNDSRTVWYAGFTPELVTTIYLGYDDNSKMGNTTGGAIVAPLWRDFYKKIIDNGYYTPSRFEYIDNLVANGKLYYQELNPLNGLITNKGGKKFLLRNNKIQLEHDGKYQKSIRDILY
ncbi:transglycosylase domain-containing protein [Fusobacterium sp.]|uniref:transglycosylase domain-containing protein n=1 Tax=Fusobacterium sp. TaxID=68766 RepID=UPI002637DD9E|nr:transglycosylase domain-containing protein [Fusobacterium sp.]